MYVGEMSILCLIRTQMIKLFKLHSKFHVCFDLSCNRVFVLIRRSAGFTPSDKFQFQVQATNCPIGASLYVVVINKAFFSTDHHHQFRNFRFSIHHISWYCNCIQSHCKPLSLFSCSEISTNSQIATSAFTGQSPGFKVQVTIHYHSRGRPTQTGQSLDTVLIQIISPTA